MNLQPFKHSRNKFVSLTAIAAAILITVPALAGSGQRQTPTSSPTGTDVQSAPTPATGAPATAPSTEATPVAPTSESPTTPDASASSGNIVDVATSSGSFKTLVEAVKAAGLTEELSGTGPYTVFAPTDAAFAALPKGTVEMLLKPENKEVLKKVLTYHVVAGAVDSGTLKSGQVKTVEGSSVNVQVSGSNVTVNDAKVTSPDIKATNGVIHVIDKVIIPPDM